MNGLVHHLPTSTTQSTSENSSDSESWSKRRLRKRAHSSSPTPSVEYANVNHAEVTSTTSPLMKNTDSANTHYTFPLPPTSLPGTTPSIEHSTASTPQLFITQRQSS